MATDPSPPGSEHAGAAPASGAEIGSTALSASPLGSTAASTAKRPLHLRIGRRGEEAAAEQLKAAGYRILARNYRCPSGEIDLVAEERGVLVFVEVKTRSSAAYGSPRDAVTPAKRRK